MTVQLERWCAKEKERCKAAGMDGIAVEMLKSRDIRITGQVLRIFNKCMESGLVPEDWKRMCQLQNNKYIKYPWQDIWKGTDQQSDGKYERTGSGGAGRIQVWKGMYRSDICIEAVG